MEKDIVKAYVAWAAVCLFWGTTYLAIRIGVDTIPPALFAGLRFLIAGTLFFSYLKLKGYPNPGARELLDIAVVSIALLTIANGLVVWSEQWVPSGLAALIVATLPFWMAGMEAVIPQGDKLTLKKVLGILIGFAGLILLLKPDFEEALDPHYLKGVIAVLAAPCAWAFGSLYSKYRGVKTNPFMGAALQMLLAGVLLSLIGVSMGETNRFTPTLPGVAAMVYLIIFGSFVGYVSYIYALSKLPASKVSMYAYINPIIAVLLGWFFLDERLDWQMLTATLLVLSGVVLVKTAPSKKSRTPQPIKNDELAEEDVTLSS